MPEAKAKSNHARHSLGRIHLGLVVTHETRDDHLRVRPVHARLVAAECAIYFLIDAAIAHTSEIDGNPNLCIAFADIRQGKYLTATGLASVLEDGAELARFWPPSDRTLWTAQQDAATTDGPSAPEERAVRVVRINPSLLEYWDSFGAIVTAVRTASSRDNPQRAGSENAHVKSRRRAY